MNRSRYAPALLLWLVLPVVMPAADTGVTTAPIAAVEQSSDEQVAAWLAAGRALKAERPELFGGAQGVLATQVLPGGQGVGTAPGDVLIRYRGTLPDSADELIGHARETSAKQSRSLGRLGSAVGEEARTLQARIQVGQSRAGFPTLPRLPSHGCWHCCMQDRLPRTRGDTARPSHCSSRV